MLDRLLNCNLSFFYFIYINYKYIKNNMDFLTKELIGVYSYTNMNEDRDSVKRVVIKGRTWYKTGTVTATTVVSLLYSIYNPSVKRNEYVVLMGVARQNPGDTNLDKNLGYEIAMENALMSPVAKIKFASEIMSTEVIEDFMRQYVNSLPVHFIKTRAELGNDIDKYDRNSRVKSDYYHKYYKDYKKIFHKK